MTKDKPFKLDRLRFYSIKYDTANPGLLKKLKLFMTDHGFHAVAVYRLGRASLNLYTKNKIIGFMPYLFYRLLNNHVKTINHVDISNGAEIGAGFFIMHHYSIIIAPVKIGKNFTIHHNLTIGQKVASLNHATPQIGDNVWIGPNCVITGGITIGNCATISAGSVITKSIPDNCLAGGNPGRVIFQNYDNTTMSIKEESEN